MDNNLDENAIRPFVAGCKIFFSYDTDRGAKASINLHYSIETGKANGIESYSYLCRAFTGLSNAIIVEDIETLLPLPLLGREVA